MTCTDFKQVFLVWLFQWVTLSLTAYHQHNISSHLLICDIGLYCKECLYLWFSVSSVFCCLVFASSKLSNWIFLKLVFVSWESWNFTSLKLRRDKVEAVIDRIIIIYSTFRVWRIKTWLKKSKNKSSKLI